MRKNRGIFTLALCCLCSISMLAQKDSTKLRTSLSAFADFYYAYDLNNGDATARQAFLFNHNRNNTLSLNLALLTYEAETDNFHANLTAQFGDYVTYNIAHEPAGLSNIFEAYGGVKAAKNLWVDAGVFSSNLGFESARSNENITLSRSLVAESSPYYLSGIRATFTPNDKWTFVGLITNGWQVMLDNNDKKAFGTQITFSPSNTLTLNHSTFIGKENGNTTRIFQDLYALIKLGDKINAIACVDFGVEGSNNWLGAALLLQYELNDELAIGVRGEYFNDPGNVVIGSLPTSQVFMINPVDLTAFSLNLDYKINKYATWRTEYRMFTSSIDAFETSGPARPPFVYSNSTSTVLTSLAVSF